MHTETKYTYEKMMEYPHMRPNDESIWNRFIEKNPDRFVSVYYVYRVGDHEHVGEDCGMCESTGWYDLTRWQIDVVAMDGKAIYVIEVKPSANAKALGQAEGYAMLYQEENAPTLPVIPVVLTDHIISTTAKIAAAHHVEMWVA